MAKKVLTERQYVNHAGSRCPICHSQHVSAEGSTDSDAQFTYQRVVCEDCGAYWQDELKLVGYFSLHDSEGKLIHE